MLFAKQTHAMLAALMALAYCLRDDPAGDGNVPDMELDAGFAGEVFQQG